jgi:hypothetical protein
MAPLKQSQIRKQTPVRSIISLFLANKARQREHSAVAFHQFNVFKKADICCLKNKRTKRYCRIEEICNSFHGIKRVFVGVSKIIGAPPLDAPLAGNYHFAIIHFATKKHSLRDIP